MALKILVFWPSFVAQNLQSELVNVFESVFLRQHQFGFLIFAPCFILPLKSPLRSSKARKRLGGWRLDLFFSFCLPSYISLFFLSLLYVNYVYISLLRPPPSCSNSSLPFSLLLLIFSLLLLHMCIRMWYVSRAFFIAGAVAEEKQFLRWNFCLCSKMLEKMWLLWQIRTGWKVASVSALPRSHVVYCSSTASLLATSTTTY